MADEDFDIRSLADYLHVDPAQIGRLADRAKLPGRKVGGQWRFSRSEIHHWLESKIGLSGEGELVEMEHALRRADAPDAARSISIASMLHLDAIEIPLQARTRGRVVERMTSLASRTGLLWDTEKMADAVRAREDMHPTAIDSGVALLHPRRPMADILGEAVMALGVTGKGVPFGGSRLTDVFFLICSVEDQGHLRVLARLSRLIGSADFLGELRRAPDARTAHDLISAREAELEGE